MPEAKIPHEKRGAEYLANERTFLAWIRTSIAVLSLGFVVSRLAIWIRALAPPDGRPYLHLRGFSFPMGELLMSFAGLLALLAAWRYHAVNRAIEEDRVRPDRALVLLVATFVALLGLGMAVAVWVSNP